MIPYIANTPKDVDEMLEVIGVKSIDDLFQDIKNQLTIELTKHKIISLNQIICVETDIDHSVIPFLVTELLPNNIIDITDIDLEIDFDECFNNDNVIESLFLYFKSKTGYATVLIPKKLKILLLKFTKNLAILKNFFLSLQYNSPKYFAERLR